MVCGPEMPVTLMVMAAFGTGFPWVSSTVATAECTDSVGSTLIATDGSIVTVCGAVGGSQAAPFARASAMIASARALMSAGPEML